MVLRASREAKEVSVCRARVSKRERRFKKKKTTACAIGRAPPFAIASSFAFFCVASPVTSSLWFDSPPSIRNKMITLFNLEYESREEKDLARLDAVAFDHEKKTESAAAMNKQNRGKRSPSNSPRHVPPRSLLFARRLQTGPPR